MNKNQAKISYDRENKVLSLEIKKAKSVDSDIQGNVVVDYDKNGKIVRLNIYGFNFDSFHGNLKILKDFSRALEIPVLVK